MSLLTIKIEKIGLKDAGQCIDPYMTISVKGNLHTSNTCLEFGEVNRHIYSRTLSAVVVPLLSHCKEKLLKHCWCAATTTGVLPPYKIYILPKPRVCAVFLCRFERRRLEPSAGHPCGHQEGRYLHSLQRGRGDPETCGETTKRWHLEFQSHTLLTSQISFATFYVFLMVNDPLCRLDQVINTFAFWCGRTTRPINLLFSSYNLVQMYINALLSPENSHQQIHDLEC